MSDVVSVLLAEDDEGHATLVRRNFKRAGLPTELVVLRDGQELLDYVHYRGSFAERPELGPTAVIVDLNMPRLGGFDVLEQLKQDQQFARIPVFVLTTSDNPLELERCYALGAAACLVKPVDYGEFGEMAQRFARFLMTTRLPPERPSTSANGR